MTRPAFSSPLKEEEFVELDELLAQLDEESMPMDASQADGFLTALCLLPKEVSPAVWMPMIFSAPSAKASKLDEKRQTRLEELVYRRYREINQMVSL